MADKSISLYLKREDEIHPEISGNKWRKLRYHLEESQREGSIGLLTFGGAFSNHIAATAAVARIAGLRAIGVIRGERIEPLNSTLALAEDQGMQLHFSTRVEYRNDKASIAEKLDPDKEFHHIPEGGADALGVKGCEEILTADDRLDFDLVCCSSGTGTTAAGIYHSLGPDQRLRVYPALKGDFMKREIMDLLPDNTNVERLFVSNRYHFGGYAKTSPELFEFMRDFHAETGVRTDPIYTAKMLYGVIEDVRKGDIKEGSRILAIHTGGLQGLRGIELREGNRIFTE